MARVLGPEEYGAFYLTVAWITILALIGKGGLDTAATRFAAAYSAAEDWSRMRGLFRFVVPAVAAGGIAAGVIFAIILTAASDHFDDSVQAALLTGALFVPVLALLQTSQATLIGLHRFVRGIVIERLAVPAISMVLVLVIDALIDGPLSARYAVMTFGVVMAIGFAVAAVWLTRAMPSAVSGAEVVSGKRHWLVTALPLAVLSATHMILNHIDTVMVGAFVDSEAAGQYGVAARLSALVLFGLIAVNGVAAPIISRHYSQGKHDALLRLAVLTARTGLAFAVVAGLFLFLFGDWALALFGRSFTASYGVLLIIMISHIINAAAGPVGVLMTMTGGERPAALAMLIALIANITLNTLLIPAYGIEGAAVATVISTALWNGLLLRTVKDRLGFLPVAFLFRARSR